MPVTFPDTIDPLVRRLDEIAGQSPHLARTARLYAAILPPLSGAEPGMEPVFLSADEAREKLERGQHLLQDIDVDLDVTAIAGLLARLAEAAAQAGENVDASKFREWLEKRGEDVGMVLQAVLEGGDSLLPNAAELGMDAGLFLAFAQNALKPGLRSLCSHLSPLAAGIPWNRGTCFVCGALPVLGELQGNAQTLHLRCGLCGADWEYRRLACVHCGREDHRERDYLLSGGPQEKEHIEACRSCRRYIKIIAAFSPTPVDLLPVEDLATVHLDVASQERGYRRTGDAL